MSLKVCLLNVNHREQQLKNERGWTKCIFQRFRERGRDYFTLTVLPVLLKRRCETVAALMLHKEQLPQPPARTKAHGWMGPVLKSSHITLRPTLTASQQPLLIPTAGSFSSCLYVHGFAHVAWCRDGLKCGPQTLSMGSRRRPGKQHELSKQCWLPARLQCVFPEHLAGTSCSYPCLWRVSCCSDLPQPTSASCQHSLRKFGEPLTEHSINSSTRVQLWETPCDCLLETALCSFFSLPGWHIEGNRNKENATLANTSLYTNIWIWVPKQQPKTASK